MIFPLYSFAEDETGIVLITGSNRGIGLEFTKQYLARGDNVIGIDNINSYYDPELKFAMVSKEVKHITKT